MYELPDIKTSAEWPLTYVSYRLNHGALTELLAEISGDREQNFDTIVISGGVGYKKQFGDRYAVRKPFTTVETAYGSVLGYFSPRQKAVFVFPEGALEGIISQVLEQGQPISRERLVRRATNLMYQVMVEELEHGFQDAYEERYVSWSYRLARFVSPIVPISVVIGVAHGYLTAKGWWWYVLILLGLLTWASLPVWTTWIPLPKTVRLWNYKRNKREVDAKREAMRVKLLRLATRAFRFEVDSIPNVRRVTKPS